MKIRKAYQAGRFYPAGAELQEMLDKFSKAAGGGSRNVICGIVPHAGIIYSGFTASFLYNSLAESYNRIIVIGPSHHVYFTGFALCSDDAWNTPLGQLNVDREFCSKLEPVAEIMDDVHTPEHSVEVQMPFIYRRFGNTVPIVPVIMGAFSREHADAFAEKLLELDDGKTLYIASSDLYHGFNYEEAKDTDAKTLAEIASGKAERFTSYARDMEKEGNPSACGSGPVYVIMRICEAMNIRMKLLNHTTSSDVTGDFTGYTVGYASFAGVKNEQ